MVSRKHSIIRMEAGRFCVEDLGSSNGTHVNEVRVTKQALNHNDVVRCGSLWLRFVEGPPARQQGPTEPPPSSGGAMALALPPVGVNPSYPAVPVAVHGDQTPGPLGLHGPSDPEEVPRLRRRVDQLQAELRIYRGGGEGAARLEQLDEEVVRLSEERDRLRGRVAELEATIRREGGDAMVQRAGAIAQTAAEIVSGLNDVLSNLRINVMAAEGEFDQYAGVVPRASFELIREALRSSASDMETARELLRRLRALSV
jgi:hypothetical protein